MLDAMHRIGQQWMIVERDMNHSSSTIISLLCPRNTKNTYYTYCAVCTSVFFKMLFYSFPCHLNAQKYLKIPVEHWAKFERVRAYSLQEK